MTREINLPVSETVEGTITRLMNGQRCGFISVANKGNVFFHVDAYREVQFNSAQSALEWKVHSPWPGGSVRIGKTVVLELGLSKTGKLRAYPWTFIDGYEQACQEQREHESIRA